MRAFAFIAIAFVFSIQKSFAQPVNAAINFTGASADASALLDVSAANKGILIPHVALTGVNDASTISSPASSLLVYNTGLGGLSPAGYYYNSSPPAVGPVWVQLLSGSSLSAVAPLFISGNTVSITSPLPIANGGTNTTTSTGSGGVVLATSPALVTPTLGVASATTLNKITFTAPATSATVEITNGKTLTVPNDATVSGTNTGDQTNVSGTSATFTGSLTGDVTSTGMATTVGKINGTSLAGLGTGILKNTTGTGIPSIAVAGDFPTLNQNTTGTASNVTGIVAIANGGTNNSSVYSSGSIPYSNGSSLTQDNSNLFWDATNHRLGVGTTSPTACLEIVKPTGTGLTFMAGVASASQQGAVFMSDNTLGFSYNVNASDIGYINFNGYHNGVTQFRDLYIANGKAAVVAYFSGVSGKVGIGTTSPVQKLELYGQNGLPATTGTTQNGNLRIGPSTNNVLDFGNTAGSPVWGSWIQSTDRSNLVANYALLLNPNGGNVGIGTTSPSSLFSVGSSSQFQVNSSGAVSAATGITSSGTITFSGLSSTGIVHNNSSGVLSTSLSSLTADVTGVLPVANGGTNNTLAYSSGSIIYSNGTSLTQNNSYLFWDNTNHRVGIGTTSPNAALSFGTGVVDNKLYIYDNTNDKYGFGIRSSQFMIYSGANGSSTGGITFGKFDGTTFTENVRFENGGNVGIGTSSPNHKLELVNDDAYKTTTTTWTTASDERLKKEIIDFTEGLATVKNIRPVKYKYKGLTNFPDDGIEHIGILAQEIQVAAPYTVVPIKIELRQSDLANFNGPTSLVRTDTVNGNSVPIYQADILGFNAHALFFVLINSVKELDAANTALKTELADLKARIEALENK